MIAPCGNVRHRSQGSTGEEKSHLAQESVMESCQKNITNNLETS
jgi:hypothetical protein